jgi:hypothetical protein
VLRGHGGPVGPRPRRAGRPPGWSGAESLRLRRGGPGVALLESLVEKHPTKNQMFGGRQTVGQSLRPKILLVYISWYINDYGRPWTSSDVNPRIRPVHGQIARPGRVLLPTTEQKASSPSPVQSERHVREPRWDRGLIFDLIRLRSPTFFGVRINAAMQVADVNGNR